MTDQDLTEKLTEDMGKCPGCGSDDLSSSIDDGLSVITIKATCGECDASWYEHYKFQGASGFEEG